MPEHKIVYRMRSIASPALRHEKHYTVRVKRGDSTQTFNPVRCHLGTVTGPQSWNGSAVVHFKLGGGGPNGYQPKILSIEIIEKEKSTKTVGVTQVDVTRALQNNSQSGVIEGLACDFRMTGIGGATFGATVTVDIAVFPVDQEQPAFTSPPPPADEELEEGEKIDVTSDANALAAVEHELARVKQLLALRAQLKEAVTEAVTLATARRVSAYVNAVWATGTYEVDPAASAGASESAARREAAKARLVVNKSAAQRSQALVDEAQARVDHSRASLATLEAAYRHRHALGRKQEELEKAQAVREVADEFIRLLTDIAEADEAVKKAQADAGVIDAKTLKDRIDEEERIVVEHKATVARHESVVADLEKTIALLATDPTTLQEYNKARIAAIAAAVTATSTAPPAKELLVVTTTATEASTTAKPVVGLDEIFLAGGNTAPPAANASPLAAPPVAAKPRHADPTLATSNNNTTTTTTTPAPISVAASMSLPPPPSNATPSSMCATSRSSNVGPGALSSLDSAQGRNFRMPAAALPQPPTTTMSTSTGRTAASASAWDSESVFVTPTTATATAIAMPPLQQPQDASSSSSATMIASSPDVQVVSSTSPASTTDAWVQQPLQPARPAEPVPTSQPFTESVQSRSLDQSLSRTVTLQPALPVAAATPPTTTPSVAALEPTAPPTADVSSVAPSAFDPFSGGANDFDNTAENELFAVNSRRAQAQPLLSMSTTTNNSSLGSTTRQRTAVVAADPFQSVEGDESLPRARGTTTTTDSGAGAATATNKDDPLNNTTTQPPAQLSATLRSTSAPAADFDPFGAAVAEVTTTSRSSSAFDTAALFAQSPKETKAPTTDLFAAHQQQQQAQEVPELTAQQPPAVVPERSTSSLAYDKPLPTKLDAELFADAPACAPERVAPVVVASAPYLPAIAATATVNVWSAATPNVDVAAARQEAMARALQNIPTTMPAPVHVANSAAVSNATSPALSRTGSQAALDSRGTSPIPAPRMPNIAAFDPFANTSSGVDAARDEDLFGGVTTTARLQQQQQQVGGRTEAAFTTLASPPKPVILDEAAKKEAARPTHDTEIFRALVGTAAQLQQQHPGKPSSAPPQQHQQQQHQQPSSAPATFPAGDDIFGAPLQPPTQRQPQQQQGTATGAKVCPTTTTHDEDFFRDFVGQKSLSSTVSQPAAQQSLSQTAFTWG